MVDLEPHFENYIDFNSIPSKYAVDIGAQDGPGPTYSLFKEKGFDGLCIEGSPDNYKDLCNNLPQSNVAKHCEFITPHNICQIFENYRVPKEPFVIKIDIDGYDYEVLDIILSKYRPLFFIAEINEKIPPPIMFRVKYTPDYVWGKNHFFGFSLECGYQICEKYGYRIIRIIGGNNILCIRNDMAYKPDALSSTEMYKRDYLENDPVRWIYHWNRDIHHWTQICYDPKLIPSTIADIIDYFTTERIKRGENIGKPVERNSFVLGYTF